MGPTGRVSGRLASLCVGLFTPTQFEQVSGRPESFLMQASPHLSVPTGQWKASILMGEALSLLSSMVSGRRDPLCLYQVNIFPIKEV